MTPEEQTQWLDDAPEPQEVLSRVLELAAGQVKKMSDRRLRMEDHSNRMRLLLAADFFYDFYYHMVDSLVPDAAREAADLHLRFAKHAMRTAVDRDNDGDAAVLASLAEACFLARGRICQECGLPQCLHYRPNDSRSSEQTWTSLRE